jgi:hypothetical protein
MNRTMIGAVFAAALLGSAAYAAGTSTPPSSTPPEPTPSTAPMTAPEKPAAKPDWAAECKELATQWETAEAANATNAKLGKAKAKANAAEKNCASTKASKQKTGVSQYKAALKLLGVKPTT